MCLQKHLESAFYTNFNNFKHGEDSWVFLHWKCFQSCWSWQIQNLLGKYNEYDAILHEFKRVSFRIEALRNRKNNHNLEYVIVVLIIALGDVKRKSYI